MSHTTSKRSSSPSSSASTLTSSSSSSSAATSASSNAVATRASSTSSSTKTPVPVGGWLAEKIHNSFLTCRLCFEAYTSPKCLSCLHTFCEGCIENLLHESDLLLAYRKYSTTDYREVVCPICRKRTQVPLGGVRRLPDNFLIEGLSETLVRQKPPKFPLCDICKLVNKKDKDASSKCLECQRMMCQDCVVLHGQTKVTSGHTIFDVEIEKEIECKDHEDEIVRFYCDTCSACICIMCTFNEHRDHEITGFHEAASKHHGRVKSMADICKKHLISSERELEALESCESLIHSVEQFIRNKAEEMLTEIKYREKQLVDQLKKIYGKQCLERIAKKKDLILKMEESKSACKLVDAVLTGREIEFLLLRNKVEEKLETLNKTPRKKLPSTVGKVLEFRPGSLDFGYLYDYDDSKSSTKNNNSVDNNNSTSTNNSTTNNSTTSTTSTTENEDNKTKRRSKTAIEINYVTAFYGGGQIHTCSVDTQTDPVEFKKLGEPSKTKKTQTVDALKKKNNETINSVAATNEPTASTNTLATTNPNIITATNQPTTNTTSTTKTTIQATPSTVTSSPSNRQPTASSSTQQPEHKATQNKTMTRPTSSSISSSVKESSLSSSSVSSSSSQIQKDTDKGTKNISLQQQNTSTEPPKLRRILKHIGSSVESFSSYDDDGNVFLQDEIQSSNPVTKIEPETKRTLSSLSSLSSSSSRQSLSSVSSLPSPNVNIAFTPSLITADVPTVLTPVSGQKASVTSADINVEKKIMASKTTSNVSLTSKNVSSTPTNVSSTSINVATMPQTVATALQNDVTIKNSTTAAKIMSTSSQKAVTTQQSPSIQCISTVPQNVVSTIKNISPTSKIQQFFHSTSTSNVMKPVLSTSSPSSSSVSQVLSTTSATLPQVASVASTSPSSTLSSSLNQGLVATSSNAIRVNNIGQKIVAETKLQPAQQPAGKNQIKTTPVVLKSSPSSSLSSSSLQALSSLTLPQSVLSSPLLSKSPSTSQSATSQSAKSLPSKATALSSTTSPQSTSPSQTSSIVRVANQTSNPLPITNVVTAIPTQLVVSPVVKPNTPVSVLPSSSTPASQSKSQPIAVTTQITPTGGSKIIATIAPAITSAIRTTSSSSLPSSSSSMTSPSDNIADQPSANNSEKVEPVKDKPAQVSNAQATITPASTSSTATPSADSGNVVYRKKPKEMTHLSDSPIFKHPYTFGETGNQKAGAYPSRHTPVLYQQPSSYLRRSHMPQTSSYLPSPSSSSSSSGASATHRMSDGSLYGHHKFY